MSEKKSHQNQHLCYYFFAGNSWFWGFLISFVGYIDVVTSGDKKLKNNKLRNRKKKRKEKKKR